MFKPKQKLVIAGAALIVFATTIPHAEAAGSRRPAQANPSALEEQPPVPEPPYPGAEENQYAADSSMVPAPEEAPPIERPIKISDDGEYYYDPNIKPKAQLGHPDIPRAKAASENGQYFYDSSDNPVKVKGHPDVEKPILTTSKGEFHYKLEERKSKSAGSFRVGTLTAPSLKNQTNGYKFEQLYGSNPALLLLGDREFRVFSSAGRLSLKLASGLMYANGQGKFKNPSRAGENPEERFNFVVFPNQITACYKFQFADRQFLVPYVEGGGGYFTFAEIRDDAKKPKVGGAAVAVAAGGLNLLLDTFDPAAVRQLDAEYGINHLWLTAEVRQFIGLRSDKDFTSTSINGGFLMEF